MGEAFWTGFAAFALHFAVGAGLLLLFAFAYVRTTPHDELKLIRAGNGPAALGLMGAMIGFAIPLSRAVEVSGDVVEAALWGCVALVTQVAAHLAARVIFPNLYKGIAEGDWAVGIVKGAAGIAIGQVTAASMTP
jgi:putative membrane protein